MAGRSVCGAVLSAVSTICERTVESGHELCNTLDERLAAAAAQYR
jgi:hypothetical protein